MSKHVVLINFTEKGLANISDSTKRAEAFRARASSVGAQVDTLLWTTGPYDGLIVLEAPDDETAAGLVLGLARGGSVSTCMLRAYDETTIGAVVSKAT
jgi:uncharacterized protein with GYD domain